MPILGSLIGLALLLWLGRSGILDDFLFRPVASAQVGGAPSPSPLWVVFLTGLTVGGLSCMAVQGGLLLATVASISAARQADGMDSAHAGLPITAAPSDWRTMAAPATQFLMGKLLAYTLLGAALGAVGARFPLRMQGWILVLAAIFMVLMALQTLGPSALGVQGLLARFIPQPPKRLQRYIRARSRRGDARGPAILGMLTIFLPCGVTLAMESLAISSGSPWAGATILALFTLGTVPLFLSLGLVVGQLGGAGGRMFRPVAALLIAAIAVFTFRSGGRLLGWGWSFGEPTGIVTGPTPAASSLNENLQIVSIQAVEGAYLPAHAQLKAGRPIRLDFRGSIKPTCTNTVEFPDLGIEEQLKGGEVTAIDLPAQKPGKLSFICSMGMFGGDIEILP